MQERLGTALPLADVEDALLAAIRFRAYPEVPAVLARLRAGGARLAVVSNWDVSLHDVLERTGLRPLVDAVVISAELGAAKPDPAIFRAALERLGAAADDAIHVGDSVEHDVAGARAAGLEAILVARNGARPPAGVRVVASLDGLLDDVGHTGRLVLCIEHACPPRPPPSRLRRSALAPELPEGVERPPPPRGPDLEAVDGVGGARSPPSAARSWGRSSSASSAPRRARASPTPPRR